MADIVGLFVGPVTEVVKCFGKPIMRQFNYLCCFNSNKEDLMEKAKKLEEKREEVERQVTLEESNGQDILSGVKTWLEKVEKIQGEKNEIDNQIRDVKSGFLAVKSRFLLSRRVKKTSEAMEKLLQECPQEGHISLPSVPASICLVPSDTLSRLERLEIQSCGKIRSLFSSSIAQDLCSLNELIIDDCGEMTKVFELVSFCKWGLSNLKVLQVWDCEEMVKVIEVVGNGETTCVFPGLQELRLVRLPKLEEFCNWGPCKFPSLREVQIYECPEMRRLSSGCLTAPNLKELIVGIKDTAISSSGQDLKPKVPSETFSRLEREMTKVFEDNKGQSSHLFGQLQTLFIYGLPKLESFCKWGSCDLSNLKVLTVLDSGEMVKVIEVDSDGERSCVFPQLQELEIIGLPKLKEFCKFGGSCEFPLLSKVSIFGCPEMERLSSGSVIAPNLKAVRVGFKDISISSGQDLNVELQKHLFKAKEEESFYKWLMKVQGMEEMSKVYSEISNTVELEIKDSTLAAEQISFPSDIVATKIHLYLPTEVILGNWIHQCIRNVEDMLSCGEGLNNLDFGQAQNLRKLTFIDSLMVTKLVNLTAPSSDDCTNFPLLEYLKLQNLVKLEEICQMPEGSSINAFNNLRELLLYDLPALKHLWKSRSPCQNNVGIPHLEVLYISNCGMMEQVFWWDDEKDIGSENHRITTIFPNLRELSLTNLPRLKALCNGIQSIEFPCFFTMVKSFSLTVDKCQQLKSLVSSISNDNQNNSEGINHGDEPLHFFCKPEKVAFSGLKSLHIGGYDNVSSIWCDKIPIQDFFGGLEYLHIHDFNNIKCLFSSSIVANLNNLEFLVIRNCAEMIKVIEDDNKEKDASCGMCVIPRLKYLTIVELPKLEMFWGWKSCPLELPSLEMVIIRSCSQMKTFSLGSVTAPYQVLLKIDGKQVINNTKNLNVMLQQPVF